MTKDQLAAIAFADAYTADVGLPTYTQLVDALRAVHDIALSPVRNANYEALTRPVGVRCHGDWCCAGQMPCPTPIACGVAS